MSTEDAGNLSFEERALFNPALLALLMHGAARGHSAKRGALPVALAYLILPLALHKPTRDALPRSIATQMGEWTQRNPLALVGLPERVRALRPFISASAILALRHGVLFGSDGQLAPGSLNRKPRDLYITDDTSECRKHSEFLGKWFARQSDVPTALAIWGLRP